VLGKLAHLPDVGILFKGADRLVKQLSVIYVLFAKYFHFPTFVR
jgi:hypothetical protein